MKVLIISTSVFPLTQSGLEGYGGLEHLCALWALELKKMGVQVSVVCPEGSDLGEGIEIVACPRGEPEEATFGRYRQRLEAREWDAVWDNSWQWFSVISQMESLKQLPIIHCYHSDPNNLGAPPPISKPCITAFSMIQAQMIAIRWNVVCQVVYHGIDLDFYKYDPSVQRSDRYLWMARYTPEKGFLECAHLARKCRIGLDAFGDTMIISSPDYANRCFAEGDSRQVRVMPGIPRHETVKQYQAHKALITWPNFVEIFGLTCIEAAACGAPVISKDSGAARELIENGKTGFVVSSLEEAEELIRTDAVSRIKPEDCRKQAERFSIERSAKGHLRLLEDVASGIYW